MSDEDTQEIDIPEVSTADEHREHSNLPVKQQLLLLAGILLLIFGTTITPKLVALLKSNEVTASLLPQDEEIQEVSPITSTDNDTTPFDDIKITGKAAYVWDIQKQRALYKKDEAKKLPLASVTKLMTALVAQEVLEEDEPIRIGELSIRQSGDSGLAEGEVFSRMTLSDLVLMSSSNDGAFALAAAAGNILLPEADGPTAFVNAMNIRAKEIGLTDTEFLNPTGLDISPTEAGAYGTARDMAFLMEYIVQNEPEILTFTRENGARVYSENGNYHDAENTNYYIDEIPGLIGSKTGYTDLAGGNLVVAFNAGLNRPMIAVVLGSTQQERFTDTVKLVEETFKYVSMESPQ